MAVSGMTDVLSAVVQGKIRAALARAGEVSGEDIYLHNVEKPMTDGSGTSQVTGAWDHRGTIPTAGVTISLAAYDPAAGTGNPTDGANTPSEDPEGKKLKAILVENEDSTNTMTFGIGGSTYALDGILISGSNKSIQVDPGGLFLWYSPLGTSAMNDGVDDEVTLAADTDDTGYAQLTTLFG